MSETRGWLRCATIGVASLLGQGGFALIAAVPVGDLLDTAFKHLDRLKEARARDLSRCAERALAALDHSHDAGTAESARLKTEELLARFGLSDERFAALGLDPDAAAASVLVHATFSRDERIEIKPLCQRLLHCFYASLPENKELLAELLPHIHRETLRRLGRLEGQLAELLAIARDGGVFQRAAEQGISEAAVRTIVARIGREEIGRKDLLPWLDNWIEAHRVEIAYQQAAAAENRELHLETQVQLRKINETIAAGGPDHHVIREHSRLALEELALACKWRSLDAQRARSSVRGLLVRLEDDLQHADRPSRAQVAYWAARLSATAPEAVAEATVLRNRALELDPELDTRVVDALLAQVRGDGQAALRHLANANNSDTRAALFTTLYQIRGQEAALAWFDDDSGRDNPGFLTGIGWCNVAVRLAEAGRWEEAAARLAAVHAAHVADWPELAFVEGVVNAALLLPPDLRHLALGMNLFYPGLSVLEGPEADHRRSLADGCFAEAVVLLDQITAPRRAQAARDWRLWLRLNSPERDVAQEARDEVADGMRDGERSIDLVPFAHAFGIPFNPDPLRRRLARCKLLGDTDERAVFAEFILAQASMTPAERADFLEREESRLAAVIAASSLVGMRVEAFAQAGRLGLARQLLRERGGELPADDAARLEALIEDFAGSDPRSRLERLWQDSSDLLDLRNLVGHLRQIRDWSALQALLRELFRRERNLRNARRLVECLGQDPNATAGDLLSFLDVNSDLVARDDDLAAERAQALFQLGRLEEARGVNDGLLSRRQDPRDLALDINLALQEGDWERFPVIVDREWPRREAYDPKILLGLAQLAAQTDTTADRAFTLAKRAAERPLDDPGVLVAAHMLAIQLGRDGDADPQWLVRALELSSADGPVRTFDLRTMVEQVLPARHDHVDRTVELWTRGQIPIHAIVSALGSTLSRILLGVSARNQAQRDGRRRTIIPTVGGNRKPVQIEDGWIIGLDLTSILVLQRLGLLRRVIEASRVALAPDTMIVLLNDRRGARFHQPSLVRAAEEVRALIDGGGLKVMGATSAELPTWLVDEVGEELASLLAAAHTDGGIVVRPAPVHKARSLSEEPADLREYGNVVISASAFVTLLQQAGELDRGTGEQAQVRLCRLGDQGNAVVESNIHLGGKAIYFDGLAIDYLQASGVLARVAAAGLDLWIHPRLRDEESALVEANREGEALAREIDEIRSTLRGALLAGQATFLPRDIRDEDSELGDGLAAAATLLSFLRNLGPCAVVACDDRMVNRNPTLSDRGGRSVPTVCVLDILRYLQKQGRITETDRWDALHGLRMGGFAFIPLEADELEARLRHAPASDGTPLVESSELRAIRQNLARLASLEAIESRAERDYVKNLLLAAVEAACRLWGDETVPVARTLACTNWLWRHVAFRAASWIPEPCDHKTDEEVREALVTRFAVWVQPMPGVARDRHAVFRMWLDREVLWPLLPANVDLLDRLTDRIGSGIERWSEETDGEEQGSLAEYLVSRQSGIIRGLLDRSADFCARLGFQTRTLVSVGNVGRFDEELLLPCARQVCSDGMEHTVLDTDGVEAVLARDGEGLTLRSSRAGGRVDELLVLSQEVRERHTAATRLLGLIGPTGGVSAEMASIAAERELSIAEATGLLHERWGGVAALQARTAEALAGSGSVEDLVPSSLGYYERFCGPAPDGSDVEKYLESVLPDHRRQLLGRDLPQGLTIALVGNLHDVLSPVRWLDGVGDDQLWEALAACEPRNDPFSLLGALDIALGRQHDARFLAFAEEALQLLAADELSRPDGTDAYALLSLFVRLACARLALMEGGACRPPIWRRLCSWTQAGLLSRLCWSVQLDLEAVRASVADAETLAVRYGRTFDLHRAPMYAAGEASAFRLRAEVLGRLVLLCRRHEAAGHGIPGYEVVARACERLNEQGQQFAWELPGPLEGHIRPTRALPPEAADALAHRLEDTPSTGVWAHLAHLSQLCSLGEDLRAGMQGPLRKLHANTANGERREILEVLYQTCRIAAAHRDGALADAVAATVHRKASVADDQDVANMLNILLLAGAAYADEEQRSAWLRDRLTDLATRLPATAVVQLRECLEELRYVSPMLNAFWARAELLSTAA